MAYPVVTYRAAWDEGSPDSSVLGGSWYQWFQYLKQDLREREELRDWPIAEKIIAISYTPGTLNIDCALGNIFKVTLGANVSAMTISNVPANTHEASLRIYFIQDGTGANSLGANATTSGANLSFLGAVTLTENVQLSSGALAGNITLSSTVNAETSASGESLTLVALSLIHI